MIDVVFGRNNILVDNLGAGTENAVVLTRRALSFRVS